MFRIYQRLRWIYLSVFGVHVIPMSAMIVWREWETGGHINFFDLLIASVQKIDDVCYLSVITSVIIVDIGRTLVGILLKAPQDRAYEEGLARGMREGKVEGVAEERERWIDYGRRMQDWHRRSKEAQEHDEPFNEPPPEAPSGGI